MARTISLLLFTTIALSGCIVTPRHVRDHRVYDDRPVVIRDRHHHDHHGKRDWDRRDRNWHDGRRSDWRDR